MPERHSSRWPCQHRPPGGGLIEIGLSGGSMVRVDASVDGNALKASPKGLAATLAGLLLEALGVEGLTTKGGGDEHQDHA